MRSGLGAASVEGMRTPVLLAGAVVVLALSGCSSSTATTSTVTAEAEPAVTVEHTVTVTVTAEAAAADAGGSDPYEAYLANNPDPDLVLSREDAQTRAILGCGTEWAPGTIDAVLQEAYAGLC